MQNSLCRRATLTVCTSRFTRPQALIHPFSCDLLRLPEPSLCFCWALEMPPAGPSAIKQGKNRFSGPFLGGGLSEALRGLRQHCDDAWGGHFRRGGYGPELSDMIQGSRVQNMLPLSCGSAFLGSQNPEYAIWALRAQGSRQ